MSISLQTQIPVFAEQPATSGKAAMSDSLTGAFTFYIFIRKITPQAALQRAVTFLLYDEFVARNCQILAYQRFIKSHENFKARYDMPFELISDPDETLCSLFDVMKMKNMYGKQVRGVERSTFLIDPKGTLVAEWRKVKVPGHALEVLDTLKQQS